MGARRTGHGASGALLALALTAGGCMTLEPAYTRPALPTPDQFPETPAQTPAAAAVTWKAFFPDPKLASVIDLGLANNRDLRVAVLNVEASREQYHIQRANLLPHLNGAAGAEYLREPAAEVGVTAPGGPNHYNVTLYTANIGVSNYEVDLFGRLRSLSHAAFEQYLQSEEARRAAQVTLISEIAADYVTLAADKALLKEAQETVESSRASLDLAQKRFDYGIASQLDVREAETVVQNARSDVAADRSTVSQDKIALDLVVGSTVPDALTPGPLDDKLSMMSDLPVGLPSSVLLSRPDVLQAEHALKSANAQIGAARAAFFPSISLTAAGGGASTTLGSLFRGASGAWSFEPQITLPLFAGGANIANLKYTKAERAIDVAQYEKAIQSAFADVADALARKATIAEQIAAQEAGLQAASETLSLSQARYERGSDTYLNVLVAQRNFYGAQQTLTSARLIRSSNLIALYKALGGGSDPVPPAQ